MICDSLNEMTRENAVAVLLRCCGSARWAGNMADARPFHGLDAVLAAADQFWESLDRAGCLEAFAAHPKIGDISQLREKFASTANWSSREQGGVNAADQQVLERLAEGNREYEKKFGYIFIVCATGKTAAEMADLLEERLTNDPDSEWPIACAEQAKIMKLRLEKLLA